MVLFGGLDGVPDLRVKRVGLAEILEHLRFREHLGGGRMAGLFRYACGNLAIACVLGMSAQMYWMLLQALSGS